jgi:small subunit ribosomal protein S14
MARKSLLQRHIKRTALVKKYSKKRQILINEINNSTSFEEKTPLQRKLQRLPRDSSATRLRNRCWKTGRGRGIYKDFGLSRHVLREMGNEGLIPGLMKASW